MPKCHYAVYGLCCHMSFLTFVHLFINFINALLNRFVCVCYGAIEIIIIIIVIIKLLLSLLQYLLTLRLRLLYD